MKSHESQVTGLIVIDKIQFLITSLSLITSTGVSKYRCLGAQIIGARTQQYVVVSV